MDPVDDVTIKVTGVSKAFKLPHEKRNSVKSLFVNIFRGRRTFEHQQVLKDVSFEVKKGEFFGIVGRNGSGKSTLLKLLAGIYTPDKGSIVVDGSLTPFIELGVGFNPELTGRENVFLNGALLGFSRKDMEAMYHDIVEFAELEKFMDQKLKNYSSGMQVRLAFSIAIRANSDILILDEVLAVGDANFQKKCFDYFHKLKADKKTVILVSHDMESVRRFSDRALLLEKSEVVLVGSAGKVSDEYIKRNMEKEDSGTASKKTLTSIDKNKLAQITSVALLDAENKEIQSLTGGSPVKIVVEYTTSSKARELNIGLGLYSNANQYVFGYNTQMDKFKITKQKGTVTLSLDNLSLLQGRYYLNVVCFGADEAIPYDYKPNVFSFDVYSFGNEQLYRGLINFKHEWVS